MVKCTPQIALLVVTDSKTDMTDQHPYFKAKELLLYRDVSIVMWLSWQNIKGAQNVVVFPPKWHLFIYFHLLSFEELGWWEPDK